MIMTNGPFKIKAIQVNKNDVPSVRRRTCYYKTVAGFNRALTNDWHPTVIQLLSASSFNDNLATIDWDVLVELCEIHPLCDVYLSQSNSCTEQLDYIKLRYPKLKIKDNTGTRLI